jgi:hypothetical protein
MRIALILLTLTACAAPRVEPSPRPAPQAAPHAHVSAPARVTLESLSVSRVEGRSPDGLTGTGTPPASAGSWTEAQLVRGRCGRCTRRWSARRPRRRRCSWGESGHGQGARGARGPRGLAPRRRALRGGRLRRPAAHAHRERALRPRARGLHGRDDEHEGAFERADGGTIFLDELGELPLELQPKLLRVLARARCAASGAAQGRKVDVRVVAATNRDLRREVNDKRFRAICSTASP